MKRSDGDLLTYGDGVLHHFTAAIETAKTAALHRERILGDYLAFRQEGVELGRNGPAELVLHSAHDPSMAEALARMLARNGVEVRDATGPVQVDGRTLPARGTYIVPMAQPAHRIAHDLLDAHVPMDEAFIQRQVDRRAQRQRDEIYDVTAWSQSLLWDVEVLTSDRATGTAGELVTADRPTAVNTTLPPALVGYLIPWGTAAASTVTEALREGIRIRSGGGEFVLGGRSYAVGTAIIRTA